jgi:hypothetical protein
MVHCVFMLAVSFTKFALLLSLVNGLTVAAWLYSSKFVRELFVHTLSIRPF